MREPGLAHLKALKGLQTLSLGDTKVADGAVVHLKELKGLQRLVLGQTQVTDAGIAELRKALPSCEIIR